MSRNIVFATLVALVLAATGCTKETGTTPNGGSTAKASQSQNTYEVEEAGTAVMYDEIDPSIMMFVETHFPQTTIQYCHMTQHYYKVKLNDNTKLQFTHSFEWVKADCEHSTIYDAVPSSIVPEQITAYVTANFPNNHIDKIEKEAFGWEIELNNDREIRFDHNFNVIGGGNGGGNTSYPEIDTFVDTYFPQVGIRSARQDGNKIEVKLTDNTEIDFSLSFDWKKIDCDEAYVYGSVPAELVPQQISAYVATNFPNNHIDKIEKEAFGWEIELNNDREIRFDHNFNVIGGGNGGGNTSYPEIDTFVDTYFPQVGIRSARQDGNKIEVKLTDNTEIDFSLSFDWKKIDCDEAYVYGSVPAELVPQQISAYVATNFPGKHIDSIEKKNNGWEIELSNGLEITFDAFFNVIEIDDKK